MFKKIVRYHCRQIIKNAIDLFSETATINVDFGNEISVKDADNDRSINLRVDAHEINGFTRNV